MTRKRIVLTVAARRDMRFRRFTFRDVQACLALGDPFDAGARQGGDPRRGREWRTGDRRCLRVVYLESARALRVLSVHEKLSPAAILRERRRRKNERP